MHLDGRLAAIARAQDMLLRSHGERGIDLAYLLGEELLAHGALEDQQVTLAGPPIELRRGRDLRVEGPDVVLTPKAGLSVAMAIHELASNAAKYGSLSDAKGQLAISWTVTGGPERRLQLIWTESGGPPVAGPPAQQGFGTTLIDRSMSYEWNAKVDRSFKESGVVCTIDLPFTTDVGALRPPERARD